MFKLRIKTTRTLTTKDLEVFCDPDLTFEAVGNIDPGTDGELREWAKAKYPPAEAVRFVPRLFLSVSQDGSAHPLDTEAGAEEFRQAVGDPFLCELVENFWNFDYFYFQNLKKNGISSANSSETLDAGSKGELKM